MHGRGVMSVRAWEREKNKGKREGGKRRWEKRRIFTLQRPRLYLQQKGPQPLARWPPQ